jgi:lambda family phage portal protein
MAEHKREPLLKVTLLDRAINFIDPEAGARRMRARAAYQSLVNLGFINGGGYDGASKTKRSMRGWLTKNTDPDAAVLPDLPTLRERSRDLFANTPLAAGILKRAKTNIAGSGLRMQCRVNRDVLGLADEAAETWERNTEARFHAFAGSPECDLTRGQCFYDLQALALLTALMSGDAFALMPRIKRAGMDSDLRIALYEGDFVSNPSGAADTAAIAGGVELDDNGAPAYYHFSDIHPGSALSFPTKWEKIPVYGEKSGRRQVLHLLQKERPGQRRGIPMLAPVIESLKQLARYTESELMAAVITSFFTVFIQQENNTAEDPLSQAITGTEKVTSPATNPTDANKVELGNGNVVQLGENEKVQFADPTKRPNSNFEMFFTAIVRQIGAALEIPFELLILHFTASYSASRGALVEAWKFFKERRTWLTRSFCQPVYSEWLYEEVLTGRIKAPGFLTDNFIRDAWLGNAWYGPGVGQIDPVKESDGARIRLETNLSTYEEEYAQIHGADWEQAMNRKSREQKFLKERDLYVPPKVGGAPGAPAGGDGNNAGGEE